MTKPDNLKEGDLQVWWIPQVPGSPFEVLVSSPVEGRKLLDVLAQYDLFQLKHHIKPDYSNAGGLCIWEDGVWVDWYDEDGNAIDDFELVGGELRLVGT